MFPSVVSETREDTEMVPEVQVPILEQAEETPKERRRRQGREHYHRNKEKIKRKRRLNRESWNKYKRKWVRDDYNNNPEKYRKYSLKRYRTKTGITMTIYNTQKRNCSIQKRIPPNYTLQEFREWCYSQSNFHELYDKWVESGYDKWKKPSTDRINTLKPYTFDNLQIVTWKENWRNAVRDNKLFRQKEVAQYSMDGKLIRLFPSILEASKSLNKPDSSNISLAATGKTKQAYGFIWKYTGKKSMGPRQDLLEKEN